MLIYHVVMYVGIRLQVYIVYKDCVCIRMTDQLQMNNTANSYIYVVYRLSLKEVDLGNKVNSGIL